MTLLEAPADLCGDPCQDAVVILVICAVAFLVLLYVSFIERRDYDRHPHDED
jgi:hypothetical protein